MKNFVIIHTGSGGSYARKIKRSVEWIALNRLHRDDFLVYTISVNQISHLFSTHPALTPETTLIYCRAAYPFDTGWMRNLSELEAQGYRLVNSVDSLKLTSNKLLCAQELLENNISHPRTWVYNRGITSRSDLIYILLSMGDRREFIAKPLTSMSQGASVKKIPTGLTVPEIITQIEQVPGDTIVLQELVDYVALYRVIVIGGVALPYAFVDRPEWHQPGDWKVSVCLNRTTMQVASLTPELKGIAERAQQLVGARISFVDIFETTDHRYTMSEINTACNLSIHEHLAQIAGESKWNIHYRIAKYLTQII